MAALRFRSNRNVTRELTYAHRVCVIMDQDTIVMDIVMHIATRYKDTSIVIFSCKLFINMLILSNKCRRTFCGSVETKLFLTPIIKQCFSCAGGQGRAAEPANCRANPDACLDYACDKVRSMHSVRCENSNNRLYLREILVNCYTPDVVQCLKDVSSWQFDDSGIT
uniref:Uncharacterized protein n=1 Tax=Romanomermis culicivorax TaxID=13658 RepID=A0A915KTM3_ROMCU